MFESLYSEKKCQNLCFFLKLENPGLHQQVAPTPTSTLWFRFRFSGFGQLILCSSHLMCAMEISRFTQIYRKNISTRYTQGEYFHI